MIATRLGLAVAAFAVGIVAAAAQEVRSYTRQGNFDDVKFELTNAITERGLTIDYNGQLGKMLDRTGADVGSTKSIYKNAEFFTFCSAKLSRAMMEADPMNAAFCPYVVFALERADAPGRVVVGFRRFPKTGSDASDKALADIDALLDGIVKQAVK